MRRCRRSGPLPTLLPPPPPSFAKSVIHAHYGRIVPPAATIAHRTDHAHHRSYSYSSNYYSSMSTTTTDASSLVLRVKRLSPHAVLPFRATEGAAGYDLCSSEETVVPSRGKALVSTDLAMAIPVGHYGRIAPRSSVSWKNHVDVGAGVIDSDYRGHVKVCLFNHSETDFTIHQGDKIAQLIIERISLPAVQEVENIDDTARGEGGFGSTGVSFKQ